MKLNKLKSNNSIYYQFDNNIFNQIKYQTYPETYLEIYNKTDDLTNLNWKDLYETK